VKRKRKRTETSKAQKKKGRPKQRRKGSLSKRTGKDRVREKALGKTETEQKKGGRWISTKKERNEENNKK